MQALLFIFIEIFLKCYHYAIIEIKRSDFMALKENMTRITVNIDKDKYEKVKEMAMKEGRAVSNYINFLIDKEIKKNQEK
jgi:hypothetical protein